MIRKGDWVQIQSYKHDGSLHRCWDNGLVLDINEEYIVIGSKKQKLQKPMEEDGLLVNQLLQYFHLKIGLM